MSLPHPQTHPEPAARDLATPTAPRSTRARTRARRGLAAGCLLATLGLWLWQGSYLALAAVGYLPIVLTKALTGNTGDLTVSALWSWPVIRSLLVIVAGLALLYAGARAWPDRGPFTAMSTRRLRQVSGCLVAVAAAIPVGYASTRVAWALGLPFGVSRTFLTEIRPIVYNGLGLALMALVGATLTLGLLQRWGEVFPRWIPGLGGKRVPIGFAVNFALAVSVLVLVAGLFFVRAVITGAGIVGAPTGADQQLGAWLPEMFWPLWALALAGAALAYRERRMRSECSSGPMTAGAVPPPS